jgi:hypothetical protein
MAFKKAENTANDSFVVTYGVTPSCFLVRWRMSIASRRLLATESTTKPEFAR